MKHFSSYTSELEFLRTKNSPQPVVITNALVYDGSGNPPFHGDVFIKDGKIVHVTRKTEELSPTGYRTIHADGLALAPGFIDPHSHSDISILARPEAYGKISQGVTTELTGNCGLSVFPSSPEVRAHLQDLYSSYGVPIQWSSLEEYAHRIGKAAPAINTGTLCGHNTLRSAVAGYQKKVLSKEELEKMKTLLDQCLTQGAFGFSTGLLYVPGIFSSPAELQEIMQVLRSHHAVYATHLRSEGDHLLEALDEALTLAQAGSGKLQISHLKTSKKQNWHKIQPVLERIRKAREQGLKITADRYPYTRSQTSLSIILPPPYDSMPDKDIQLELSSNPERFQQLICELRTTGISKDILLTATNYTPFKPFTGMTLEQAALAAGLEIEIFTAEILKHDSTGTMAAFSGLSEDNLQILLKQPWLCCGSDENARPRDESIGRSHPRAFGSFPRFFRMVQELVSPQEAIRRMTSLPAEIFSIPGRGRIQDGFAADLVLFYPEKFLDTADFHHPHSPAEGLEAVFVNGILAFADGEVCQRGGRFLRRQS